MLKDEVKGSVTQVGEEKWQLEVNLGTYVDPKTLKKKRNRKYRTVEAKNKRQAEVLLARWIAELTDVTYFEPEKMSFVEFVKNEWEPRCAKKRLAPTTYYQYMRCVNSRILPAFQYLRMDQVKPKHIIDFLDNLEEEGMRMDGKEGKLSSSRVYYFYRVLNNIFNFAVELQILKENPVKKIKKPKVEYKDVEIYTAEETARLLKCLDTETDVPHWQIIIKLAIITGMRRSELCGLEFKHIDYENNVVRIRQALTYTSEHGYEIHEIRKGSRSSKKRDVYLPKSLVEDIKQLEDQRNLERKSARNLWQDGKYNFILAHEDGRPYNPRSVQQWWERFLKRHNLKYINLHALRHTSATLLISLNTHARTISERLGHSNTTVTMGRYGHAITEADKIATEKLAEAINLK